MKNSKKFSINDLKKKAGKAFLNVDAVKGGRLDGCHVEPIRIDPPIHPCDNV